MAGRMMPSDGAWQSLGAAGARSRLIDLMRRQGPGGARGERRSSSTSTPPIRRIRARIRSTPGAEPVVVPGVAGRCPGTTMPHALRYSQARRRSVSAMPGIASRIKVANGPSRSQPVTSIAGVAAVNSSGAGDSAGCDAGPRCGGPVPRRPASGYAVPQRRYPAARAGCTRGLGPQARECAPQAGSRGVTARRRRRAGPGAGRPARTGPR